MPFDTENQNIASDFVANDTRVQIGSKDTKATSIVKLAKSFNVKDSDVPGSVVFVFPLDTSITKEILDASQYYEEFGISDLEVSFQSTSPMGTASGAVQIAHIPDPYNVNFGSETDTEKVLTKIVRQDGSMEIRPRDTKLFTTVTKDTCFTLESPDKRYSSHGNIVGVVRDSPSAGDTARWTVTLTCTYNFFRPTILTSTTSATDKIYLTKFSQDDRSITFTVPDIPSFGDLECKTFFPITIRYSVKTNGISLSRMRTIKKFRLNKTNLVNVFRLDFNSILPSNAEKVDFITTDKFPVSCTYNYIAP